MKWCFFVIPNDLSNIEINEKQIAVKFYAILSIITMGAKARLIHFSKWNSSVNIHWFDINKSFAVLLLLHKIQSLIAMPTMSIILSSLRTHALDVYGKNKQICIYLRKTFACVKWANSVFFFQRNSIICWFKNHFLFNCQKRTYYYCIYFLRSRHFFSTVIFISKTLEKISII